MCVCRGFPSQEKDLIISCSVKSCVGGYTPEIKKFAYFVFIFCVSIFYRIGESVFVKEL